ncbi:MAG: hypothetical protein KBH92_10120 [Syntrophaceae bacterium]|nr:hypothetical protein [Syntrophaceae bacterium]MBP9530893.1 hypothetical protein [Syntrophaceae bacterium]MBP9650235.1 hypothetical protein [Syntrophaceae bacterium]
MYPELFPSAGPPDRRVHGGNGCRHDDHQSHGQSGFFFSTAKDNTVSRIVPHLDADAIVTTPRRDPHYLITEYGAVDLKGKCKRDRALAIIGIAHPDFRDPPMREAEKMRLF